MQDRPTLRELLDAAEDFLRTDLRPQLSGAAQFHTLVDGQRALDHQARARRLRDLQRRRKPSVCARCSAPGADGGLRELNFELCRRIRAGEIAIDRADLIDHLIRTTLAKGAIDNPRYAGHLRVLRQWPDKAPAEPAVFDTRR